MEIEVLVYDGIKLNELGDNIDKLVDKVSIQTFSEFGKSVWLMLRRVKFHCYTASLKIGSQSEGIPWQVQKWKNVKKEQQAQKRGLRKELKKKLDNNE